MQQLTLTSIQHNRLIDMCNHLFKNPTAQWDVERWKTDPKAGTYIKVGNDTIHWFEFLFLHVAPKVAELLSLNPIITKSFAMYMVQQKLLVDITFNNPVDGIYDIWLNPNKYIPDV